MTPAQDIATKINTTPGGRNYAHRPRGAVLVMAIAASLAALLPNVAQAHHFVSGVGGAQINLSPDGYPHGPGDPGEPYHLLGRDYAVTGTGFAPGGLVRIFQCPVTRTAAVLLECEELIVVGPPAVATGTGTFNAVVHMDDKFTSANYPNGACYGPDFGTGPLAARSVQCSVLALQPGTAQAEHYVCFTGMFIGTGPTDTKCVPEP